MDPNETLRQLRALTTQLSLRVASVEARGMNSPVYDELAEGVAELSELFQALDEWLSRGGFPPEEWREGPDAPDERSDEVRDALAHAYLDLHTLLDEKNVGAYRMSQTLDRLAGALRAVGSSGADALGYDPDPLGGPVPGVNGSHLPDEERQPWVNPDDFVDPDLWKDA